MNNDSHAAADLLLFFPKYAAYNPNVISHNTPGLKWTIIFRELAMLYSLSLAQPHSTRKAPEPPLSHSKLLTTTHLLRMFQSMITKQYRTTQEGFICLKILCHPLLRLTHPPAILPSQ